MGIMARRRQKAEVKVVSGAVELPKVTKPAEEEKKEEEVKPAPKVMVRRSKE